MDSFTMNALEAVRTAKNTVSDAMVSKDLQPDQRTQLVNLYWDLEDLEQKLIVEDISKQVDVLTSDAKDLQNVTAEMQGDIAALNAVVSAVNTAAQAVAAVVQIAQTAAAAGFL